MPWKVEKKLNFFSVRGWRTFSEIILPSYIHFEPEGFPLLETFCYSITKELLNYNSIFLNFLRRHWRYNFLKRHNCVLYFYNVISCAIFQWTDGKVIPKLKNTIPIGRYLCCIILHERKSFSAVFMNDL